MQTRLKVIAGLGGVLICGAFVFCSMNSQGSSNSRTTSNNSSTSKTSTVIKDIGYSEGTASLKAEMNMKWEVRSYFTSYPSINIGKDSVTEKIYKSRQVKKDENGNKIELPKDQQGDEIWSKYEYEIVDIDCYYVEIKGNASGYVDDYNSDFNKMTFTYSAYFSKEDSAIFEEKFDYDWKY